MKRRVAVVGGGWAGLAAAVEATARGHAVDLFEMAGQLGGRARSLGAEVGIDADTPTNIHTDVDTGAEAGARAAAPDAPQRLDNGQHILIGAYTATLDLMRRVGVAPDQVLTRRPLELIDASGQGLRLRPGAALPAFALGVCRMAHWSLGERWALQRAAAGWLWRRFRCDPALTVAHLCAGLPQRVRRDVIDPLCVAALNTPADAASAQVFLRVLQDALFGGPGASDLLIPRRPLAELLPEPAGRWLKAHGARVHPRQRVQTLVQAGAGWRVGTGDTGNFGNVGDTSDNRDTHDFDHVVLACSAAESARLTRSVAPAWAEQAAAFTYEPIVTVYLQAPGARLVAPMIALCDDASAPAQFAFDHGALGATPGVFAFVVSGATAWVARGLAATTAATEQQARLALQGAGKVRVLRVVAEKRATFRCVPLLQRPAARIAPGLTAAGDHVEGPYPSTLEGAVRSGVSAARQI